ncbi:VTT domain-containing protein [Nakamurella aerolata]|uniref:DedA family protein n=1 Tax=Nakamurella aerolata TaxID=1656892 RepID=A0A849A772_9ACTN|nr:hypothetical protein [Nakamurella aerolata]
MLAGWADAVGSWGPWVIAVLAVTCLVAETSSPAGILMPSAALLLILGGLTVGRPTFWVVLACCVAGCVAGDLLGVFLGPRLRVPAAMRTTRLSAPKRRPAGRPARLRGAMDRADAFAARHGWLAVGLARFVPYLRSVVPNVVGRRGSRPWPVAAASVPAATVWVTLELTLGGSAARLLGGG